MKKVIILTLIYIGFSFSVSATQSDFAQAIEKNEVDIAEQAYQALTADEKRQLTTKILYGRLLLQQNKGEESFDFLEKIIEKNSTNIDAQYYFGMSAMVMAQQASIFSKLSYAKDGLHAWEKVVALDNEHLDALNGLIGFHLAAPGIAGGDTDKALAYAKQIKDIDAELGYASMANVYWQTEKLPLAEKTITDGIIAFPDSSKLYFIRAIARINEEAWQAAWADLVMAKSNAITDEDKGQALYQLGKVAAESGQELDSGISALEELISLDTELYENWSQYRLAQLYVQKNQLSNANKMIASIDYSDNSRLEKKVKKLKKSVKKLSKKN